MVRPNTQLFVQGSRRRDGHTNDGVPGDCFRTALASLLGLSPTDVPHFGLRVSWWWETRRWLLAERGCDLLYAQPVEALTAWLPAHDHRTPVLLGGPSPRGSFQHVVVGLIDGTVLCDPHPSRAGLSAVTEVFALTEPYAGIPDRLALEVS